LLDAYRSTHRPAWRVYEPRSVSVVLGAGRKAEDDVLTHAAARDGVPVLRRRGGGGTVVLAPGQLVLALVTRVESPFNNREYAAAIGQWFVDALGRSGWHGPEIAPRGITDLAIGERKILGSSIYRSRHILFYQASMLVAADLSLFTRYLRFPSRAPEYRRGRGHLSFCTTLREQGLDRSFDEVAASLEQVVEQRVKGFS
jgi:lipoate-protein ligase A